MSKGTAGRPPATCHPDLPQHAQGLCNTCYRRSVRKPVPRRPRPLALCHPDRPNHAHGLCFSCYQRDWKLHRRAEDDQYRAAYNQKRQGQNYKLSVEDLARMQAEQDGICAACGDECDRLQVDHCHDSGRIRALLCPSCNAAAGQAKDDPARLRAIADYLERHSVGLTSTPPA